MNLGQTRIAVRERGTAEVLDLACRVPFALGGGLYAWLSALTVLPCVTLCAAGLWLDIAGGWVWAFAVLCFVFIQGPFTLAASRLMFSSQVTPREVLVQFLRSAWPYTVTQLFKGLLLAGSALLFIAAPIVWVRLLFLSEITLLEGTKLVPSYRRSVRLNRSRVGPAFATWLALLGVAAGFILCAHVLIEAVTADLLGLGSVASLWAHGPCTLSCVGLLCAAPFVATARYLAYIDGRTRREGWDVQVDFMRIAGELAKAS
ncbi:MAG TPA: hypothetical protein VNW92_02725 [Polyangiaceae bacterium]|jgi:hypothetical protein|nr:hypothetical protein [Polyangiaceae bacterium]